jgi:hypothetical protein
MEKRWDFTSYSIMMFLSAVMVCIFPEQFITGNSDKQTVCIIMTVIMIITGSFLLYKLLKKRDE